MLNSHHMQANGEMNGGHSSQTIVSASHCSPPPPYNPDPSLVRYLTLQWHLFLTLLLRDALVMLCWSAAIRNSTFFMSIYSSSFQRAELASKSPNCVSHTYIDTHDTRPHHTHFLRSHYFQCTTKNYLLKKFPLFIFPLISIFTFFPTYFNMTCLWSHFNTFLAIFTLLFF